jgi:chaperonin GroEL (HSP60 family)
MVIRVEVREVGGKKVTVFDQQLDEDTTVATIVVRASTENVLNDVERAIDDGIFSVKTLFIDPRLLPGAGKWFIFSYVKLSITDRCGGVRCGGIRIIKTVKEVCR